MLRGDDVSFVRRWSSKTIIAAEAVLARLMLFFFFFFLSFLMITSISVVSICIHHLITARTRTAHFELGVELHVGPVGVDQQRFM